MKESELVVQILVSIFGIMLKESEPIVQTLIPIFGIIPSLLIADKNKWGWIVGLVSQPLWLITAINNKQMGSFTMTVVYIAINCYGIYKWFKENGHHN